jgi:hypothetical protein
MKPALTLLALLVAALGSAALLHAAECRPHFIEPCKWHSLAVEIRCSRNANGRATLFLDDMPQPAVVVDGPNMHNDFQYFFLHGMYHHPEIATDNWIYLDDLTITTQDM